MKNKWRLIRSRCGEFEHWYIQQRRWLVVWRDVVEYTGAGTACRILFVSRELALGWIGRRESPTIEVKSVWEVFRDRTGTLRAVPALHPGEFPTFEEFKEFVQQPPTNP